MMCFSSRHNVQTWTIFKWKHQRDKKKERLRTWLREPAGLLVRTRRAAAISNVHKSLGGIEPKHTLWNVGERKKKVSKYYTNGQIQKKPAIDQSNLARQPVDRSPSKYNTPHFWDFNSFQRTAVILFWWAVLPCANSKGMLPYNAMGLPMQGKRNIHMISAQCLKGVSSGKGQQLPHFENSFFVPYIA